MNISYNWLKEHIQTALSPEEIAQTLTTIGLETGSIEVVESVPGGLRGLVIGEVLTCVPHEQSDHLHVTTVSIGSGEPLQIVCGAPNVAAGYAVVVATIGTVLGHGAETFTIKKSKIRGVESHGMLCSASEIGIGTDHQGIILLPLEEVTIGMPAAEYYGVTSDHVLEVDITPNRVDATSHYGVARDLAAYCTQHITPTRATRPSVPQLPYGGCPVSVEVRAEASLVPRFEGIVLRGLTVQDSPEWLRFRLEAIGQKPINNIVDITNYVLHEYGQPLHAYDLDQVAGGSLIVDLARAEQSIRLLDHEEHRLTPEDIVIGDAEGHVLCLGGVMGGERSGTTANTTSIFLEAANFNASFVRKSARRHGLNTDSSFRFERGLDPEQTSWALARAVSLILELCPTAYIDGGVSDHYPIKSSPYSVEFSLERTTQLLGISIPEQDVERILGSLEIDIATRHNGNWLLHVPRYRVDVSREVDVIEEILRIYGYDNVPLSGYLHSNLSHGTERDRSYRRRLRISEQLVGAGFNEILCNSLTSAAYYDGLNTFPSEHLVRLVNPLSAELGVLRQTLLFGGLASINRNLRRQGHSFYLFEWGNCYSYTNQTEGSEQPMAAYSERLHLGLWIAGDRVAGNWAHPDEQTSPFELKAHVEHILQRLGVNVGLLRYEEAARDIYQGQALLISADGGRLPIGHLGVISPALLKALDIDMPVYFAELEWPTLELLAERSKTTITDLPKYPVVRRDLSLLLDSQITFAQIEAVAYKSEKKLLKKCELFDVYEGKNLPAGKKSYAVAFYLQDETQTMDDKQIEAIMSKIQKMLETQLATSLR